MINLLIGFDEIRLAEWGTHDSPSSPNNDLYNVHTPKWHEIREWVGTWNMEWYRTLLDFYIKTRVYDVSPSSSFIYSHEETQIYVFVGNFSRLPMA